MCTLKCDQTTEAELLFCFRRCGSLTSSSGLYIQISGTADKERVAEVEHKSEAAFIAMLSDLIKIKS